MFTRRTFLRFAGGGFASALALGSYAFVIEPMVRLQTTTYKPQIKNWPSDLKLRVVALADIHACKPWMTGERIRYIVQQANRLKPDIILLLGDYSAGMNFVTEYVHSSEWAPILAELEAPLGRYAVLGNHDWWEDKTAQRSGMGPTFGHKALETVGIPVLENNVVSIVKDGQKIWLGGLGDQLAFTPSSKFKKWKGVDDLDGMLEQVNDDAPVIMMAHEPDVFTKVPKRVSLTLSGHTHGGQVRLFGHSPVVPSKYGNRFAYGHIVEDDRHLIVSGGLGCSILPVRFGSPPEIVVVELGNETTI